MYVYIYIYIYIYIYTCPSVVARAVSDHIIYTYNHDNINNCYHY